MWKSLQDFKAGTAGRTPGLDSIRPDGFYCSLIWWESRLADSISFFFWSTSEWNWWPVRVFSSSWLYLPTKCLLYRTILAYFASSTLGMATGWGDFSRWAIPRIVSMCTIDTCKVKSQPFYQHRENSGCWQNEMQPRLTFIRVRVLVWGSSVESAVAKGIILECI